METNQQDPVYRESSEARSARLFTSDEIQQVSELLAVGSMTSYESTYSNRGFTIQIEPLSKGYLATVGCQRIAISNKETLKKHFCDYIDNPEEFTKKYNNNEIKF